MEPDARREMVIRDIGEEARRAEYQIKNRENAQPKGVEKTRQQEEVHTQTKGFHGLPEERGMNLGRGHTAPSGSTSTGPTPSLSVHLMQSDRPSTVSPALISSGDVEANSSAKPSNLSNPESSPEILSPSEADGTRRETEHANNVQEEFHNEQANQREVEKPGEKEEIARREQEELRRKETEGREAVKQNEVGDLEARKEEEAVQNGFLLQNRGESNMSSLSSDSNHILQRIFGIEAPSSSPRWRVPVFADLTGQITTVQEELDSGAFAVIHRGRWRNDQGEHDVAVKVLRVLKRGGDAGLTRLNKRLGREIRAWYRLDHPNVVKLLGVSYHMGGRPAMIMYWHQNGNATKYLTSRENSTVTKMAIINDVARGLTYLHTSDPPVVHGDLKANNILITDDGHAALTDFGLSQVIEETFGPTGLTTTTIAGAIRWQAPELIAGDLEDGDTERLTTASDVWSFACTAYELLTGMIPYYQYRIMGPVVMDIMRHIKPRWEENGSALSEASDDLRGLLDHCWSFDASERPSMLEVGARLGPLDH